MVFGESAVPLLPTFPAEFTAASAASFGWLKRLVLPGKQTLHAWRAGVLSAAGQLESGGVLGLTSARPPQSQSIVTGSTRESRQTAAARIGEGEHRSLPAR